MRPIFLWVLQMFEIEPSWKDALRSELAKPYIQKLEAFVMRERTGACPVYPPAELTFNAFWRTPFHDVSVVIVGQDPYHGPGQAHGLCFSVPKGIPVPPSLKNIYKEIGEDLGIPPPNHGCLLEWADQGVFMLNTLLTVREKTPLSHQKQGWEQFTDAAILALAKRPEPVVFLLWGGPAQKKWNALHAEGLIKSHAVLKAAHPSPLSAHAGFFGCRHFSQTNEYLVRWRRKPIDWKLSA